MIPRVLLPILLAFAASFPAQTLAHRNWAGSGILVEPWYAHALLYQIDPLSFQDSTADGFGDLRGLTLRLDYLQSLAPDALLLGPVELDPEPTHGNSEADFDQLLAEASRHHLRILVDLPTSLPDPAAQARFWLTRGVAGLRLVDSPGIPAAWSPDTLTQLRRLVASYPGDRILLNDLPDADSRIDRTLNAASALTVPLLQSLIAGPPQQAFSRSSRLHPTRLQTLLASDAPTFPRSWNRLEPDPLQRDATARLLATILLTTRAGAVLYFGQEIGMASLPTPAAQPSRMQWGTLVLPGTTPETSPATPQLSLDPKASTNNVAAEDSDPGSLLNFYRALTTLHHDKPALRSGSSELLSLGIPGLLAYLRRPAPGAGTPVLILLNLSRQPVTVSLRATLTRLGLGTSTLRTLLRSTSSASTDSLEITQLPPRSSFLGELRPPPGLEAYPQPFTVHHRR